MKRIAIAALILVFVLIGGIALLGRNKTASNEETLLPTPTAVLPTVSSDVKVEMIPSNGNKSITVKISGIPDGTNSIEYELTYLTGDGLPRGVLGKIELQNGEREITRDEIVLGTCSSGKCVYDTGVEKIDLSLKFNGEKQVSVFQKFYDL